MGLNTRKDMRILYFTLSIIVCSIEGIADVINKERLEVFLERPAPHSCASVDSHDKLLGTIQKNRLAGENSILVAVLNAFDKNEQCKRNFIEMGANDGVNSNTLGLERVYNWTGVCVEPGIHNFRKLVKNRPKCKNMNVAVGSRERTSIIFREFEYSLYGHSGFKDARPDKDWEALMRAHPRSAASMIDHNVTVISSEELFDTIGVRTIDFFSLDVEGNEMEILTSFPFENVQVKVWAIETNKLDRIHLIEFMRNKNYDCFHYDTTNTICSLTRRRP